MWKNKFYFQVQVYKNPFTLHVNYFHMADLTHRLPHLRFLKWSRIRGRLSQNFRTRPKIFGRLKITIRRRLILMKTYAIIKKDYLK